MITLPTQLANFMKGKDLAGLKPFALLYRNKWNSVTEKYELDTTPIDISAHITKPNTLSMTLDVNEVAQYNANNVTLSLSDTKNQFVEGTPESYFPAGYQIYGSKVVLYYGITSPINPYHTQVGYTVVGTPTISENGVVSDFATSSFLATPPFNPGANPWELVFEFTTGATFKSQGVMTKIGNDKGLTPLYINSSGNMAIWASSNGTVEDIANSVIYGPCAANTTYRIKQKFTGTNYKIYLWENNSWSLKKTINSSMPIYGSTPFAFGNNGGNTSPFRGTINIKNTYIKVNGEYWFNGAHFFWQNNSTPLFTGVIKELPAHKPDKYQVDLKLVSPLEMLKDIEAKDFSDKVTGETLTYQGTDDDGHRIYWTSGTGVGGFDAVYADGAKLFEGIDFETDQLNLYGTHAVVTIINSAYYSATITADYYTWKTGLTVEQIVSGLVALGGYTSANEDIRDVIWQTSVRTSVAPTALFTLGYTPNNSNGFNFTGGGNSLWGSNLAPNTWLHAQSIYPDNFIYELTIGVASYNRTYVFLGEMRPNPDWYNQPTLYNGFSFTSDYASSIDCVFTQNGVGTNFTLWASNSNKIYIKKTGNVYEFYTDQQYAPGVQYTATANFDLNFGGQNLHAYNRDQKYYLPALLSQKLTDTDTGIVLDKCGIAYQVTQGVETSWVSIEAEKSNDDAHTSIKYRTSDNGTDFTAWNATDLGSDLGVSSKIIQFVLTSTNAGNAADFSNVVVYYLGSTLTLQLVNLSGLTVLEALQDFALISGYEFGVDRNGVFFFRPRVSSTNPVYELGHDEVVKVDTVKKNLSDFFTKLTLTFAQVPLEFYANTGARPTPIDKYGVINKEIDKPDIVNYDNPELAQAIGPQLLEVYSALPNVIQAVGKLNLALELGDIVNLKRNLNLIANPEGSDFNKYRRQQTYYRACKITGMNYNFAKRQITYTLRDVSNSNNRPQIYAYGFPYDLPIQLGKLKTE